ncbi:hypothetical protein LCGC14_0655940 [marine sediment metagenome]|uniref:Methyltransferase type 11 domain-containing protein n=1 Tax=marine sediment metagenome TaxID=412755 RepID=A0A0F9QV20_9ZZZZ
MEEKNKPEIGREHEKKLNLGCGKRVLKGYINLDIIKLEGVEVVHDLNKFPYPFLDNSFDEIRANSIFEHLYNLPNVLEELWRISKPGAIINIGVPHFASLGAFVDLTHKQFFTYYSFDYYSENPKKEISNLNYYSKARFKISKRKIIYPKYFKIFEWFANKVPHFHEIMLRKFLPVKSLYFKLEVKK